MSLVNSVNGSIGTEGVDRGLHTDHHGIDTDITGDCHHAHRRELLAQGLQRSEDGDTPVYVPPCPLCEWQYREAVENFYADMPSLDVYDKFFRLTAEHEGMPELESQQSLIYTTYKIAEQVLGARKICE